MYTGSCVVGGDLKGLDLFEIALVYGSEVQ